MKWLRRLAGRGRAAKPQPLPSREALVSALQRGNTQSRRRAAFDLGKLRDPEAVEPLIAALEGPTMGAAASALGEIGDARAVAPLVAAFAGGDRMARRMIAEALGKLGDPSAIEPLVGALSDRDEELRRRAARALHQLGWRAADERQRALRAVAAGDWDEAVGLGPAALEPLLDVFRATVGPDRGAAAAALGRLGDERAVAALVSALHDRHSSARREILEALARLDPAHAAERWVVVLSSCSRRFRSDRELLGVAIGALRETRPSGETAITTSLLALLGDRWPSTQRAAAAARVLEGSPVPEIVEALVAYRGRLESYRRGLTKAPLDDLLAELVAIGRSAGYLRHQGDLTDFEDGCNVRAWDIGAELERRGGRRLMLCGHDLVAAELGRLPARHLESSWDGIGDWLG